MKLTDFLYRYAINLYHEVCCAVWPRLLSDEKAVIRYYRKKSNGHELNLKNPQKFSEKLQWYKLNHRDPLMQEVANKYTVRDYVTACGYGDALNEVLGVWNQVSDVQWDALPSQFALKGTHGSGFNLIVRDKSKVNWNMWKLIFASWLRQNNYWAGREWVYQNMPRQILAEKYLEDETGELRDYKFYCFHGKPAFMQLEVGRNTKHNTRNFYDMNWRLLPFGKELPHNPDLEVPRPLQFTQMQKMAEDLCQPFQYVRVDLYEVGGKLYFGELTFFPAGGAPDFVPSEYDRIVGDMWTITE